MGRAAVVSQPVSALFPVSTAGKVLGYSFCPSACVEFQSRLIKPPSVG